MPRGGETESETESWLANGRDAHRGDLFFSYIFVLSLREARGNDPPKTDRLAHHRQKKSSQPSAPRRPVVVVVVVVLYPVRSLPHRARTRTVFCEMKI